MQIVIDIPEKTMEHIMYSEETFQEVNDLLIRVARGTPLPKGHGRLKDIDKIEWYGCTTAFDCPYKDRECKDCNRAQCGKTQVDDIPTIIEADRGDEE